jgi:cytochrome c
MAPIANSERDSVMKIIILASSLTLLLLSGSSVADEALATQKGCLHCHAIDHAVVGPAYRDVAKKYAGQDVTDRLAEKVVKGGAGVWGAMPMPPNAVTPDEAKKLVQWVLSQK